MNPNNASARPQPNVQPHLQPSNGRGLHPDLAGQKPADEPVVHANLTSDSTHAALPDGLAQIDGDQTQVLGDRVAAGLVGPTGAAHAGRAASRSGHEATLGPQDEEVSSTWLNGRLELLSTPLEDRYPRLAEEALAYIVSYTPRINPAEWEAIAPFVRDAVAAADPPRADTAKNWLHAVSLLANWCETTACIDLTWENVFHADTIERFIQQTESTNRSTRGTYRSWLFAVAEQLVGPQKQSQIRRTVGRWEGAEAYTPAEVTSLRLAQRVQGTTYACLNYGLLLALGAGAGLTTGEMFGLCQRDITHRDGVYVITLPASRYRKPRQVPMLAIWEDLLTPGLRPTQPDAPVVLTQSERTSPNAINRFIARARKNGLAPSMWRLRATWTVTLLDAGVPLPDLLAVGGFESLSKFERFIPQLTRYAAEERDLRIRAAGAFS